MLRFRAAFILAFTLIVTSAFSQQQWPKTLLWRISGNGLTKPSYLYGTVHLQDKRLFSFTDSVYHSLESVEGFALEIDFNELMDSVFTRGFREAEDELLDEEEVEVDENDIDKSVDSILMALDIKPGKMSRKDLKKIRDYRMNRIVQKGEMQTIVDGYLYGLALRMGKWIGGIEDVSDQLDLKDVLGRELSVDEVFIPETKMRNSLEEMIRLYVNRDLQGIADFIDGSYNENKKDILLVNRNYKMVRRMDSLTKFRTMFFAVGAAHLPGEEGVINILRAQGFDVVPVLSDQTILPETYSAKLATLPWSTVESEMYSIEMPGQPKQHNVMGDVLEMKIYFDLPTMTVYMSGHTLSTQRSVDIDNAMNDMAEKMGVSLKKIKPKNITVGGIKGKEASFETNEGAIKIRLLQKDNTMYLLMALSTKSSNLNSKEISKFFGSFAAKEFSGSNTAWEKFTIPGKSFSVELPGKPRSNRAIDAKAEGSEWKFFTYDLSDNQNGLYYLVQVRDILPGYFLEGDSTYFTVYKNDIKDNFDQVKKEEQLEFKGWPAYRLDVTLQPNALFKMLIVLRGNRVYTIVAGGAENADFSQVERVFQSLTIEDYKPGSFQVQKGKGFSTSAPAAFTNNKEDELEDEEDEEDEHYSSYNVAESISFDVYKTALSPYYFAKSDSVFFEAQIKGYRSYLDSVIKKEIVYNGKLKAVDFVLQREGSNTLRRVRTVLSKDTVYNLVVYLPSPFLNNAEINSFFNDFRVAKEEAPVIFTNKTKELIAAMQLKDSLAFNKAMEAMNLVEFSKEDLPLLHEAILVNYPYSDMYFSGTDILSREIQNLNDPSTIRFVSENYNKLTGEKEILKYSLLQLLAYNKTKESYQLLKQLLVNNKPVLGDATSLNYPLSDSLELTKDLFPGILTLAGDSLFTDVLVNTANNLIDSGLLKIQDLYPVKETLLSYARKKFHAVKETEDYWWNYAEYINLMGSFNDKESLDLLFEIAGSRNRDIQYTAVVKLINKGQKPSEAMLDTLASSNSYRQYLFDELKKLDKLSYFPSRFATQARLAESEIHNIATDDYEPSSIEFLGERMIEFRGKKQKFFLFAVNFEGEDYKEQYLGMTGPYANKGKDLISSSEASGLLWSEELDLSELERQVKNLVAQMESYSSTED